MIGIILFIFWREVLFSGKQDYEPHDAKRVGWAGGHRSVEDGGEGRRLGLGWRDYACFVGVGGGLTAPESPCLRIVGADRGSRTKLEMQMLRVGAYRAKKHLSRPEVSHSEIIESVQAIHSS